MSIPKCAHFGHAVAVLGDKAYILGGEVISSPENNNFTEADTNLYEITLETLLDNPDSAPAVNVNSLPSNLPTLSGVLLFANPSTNSLTYLPGKHTTHEAPPTSALRHTPRLPFQNSLWTYSSATKWSNRTSYPAPAPLQYTYAYSASAVDEAQGRAWVFGGFLGKDGWLEEGEWKGPEEVVVEEGRRRPGNGVLLEVDLKDPGKGVKAVEGAQEVQGMGVGDGKRGEMGMVFVEGYGEKGVLVVVSGRGVMAGEPPIALIHDLNSHKWFTQPISLPPTNPTSTTHIPPLPPILDCAIAVPAPDRSSLNIYTYIHFPSTNTTAMYILSLPSFQWIHVPPVAGSGPGDENSPTAAPGGGKCVRIPGEPRKMAVYGGGGGGGGRGSKQKCMNDSQGWRVFDLSRLEWGRKVGLGSDGKVKRGEDYVVPKVVYDVIGGGPSGNATMKTPQAPNTFTDPLLGSIFATQKPSPSTASNPSKQPPTTSSIRTTIPTNTAPSSFHDPYITQKNTVPPSYLPWLLLGVFAVIAFAAIGVAVWRAGKEAGRRPGMGMELQAVGGAGGAGTVVGKKGVRVEEAAVPLAGNEGGEVV